MVDVLVRRTGRQLLDEYRLARRVREALLESLFEIPALRDALGRFFTFGIQDDLSVKPGWVLTSNWVHPDGSVLFCSFSRWDWPGRDDVPSLDEEVTPAMLSLPMQLLFKTLEHLGFQPRLTQWDGSGEYVLAVTTPWGTQPPTPVTAPAEEELGPTTYLQAAIRVLQQHGRPLTTTAITKEALRRGWLKGDSKTPTISMSATLSVHSKKANARIRVHGARSRRPIQWALATGS